MTNELGQAAGRGDAGQSRLGEGFGLQPEARRQGQAQPEPRQEDIRRFQQAFAPAAHAAPGGDTPSLPSGPFDLLARGLAAPQEPSLAAATATSETLAPTQPALALGERLREMVTRLMVSDGLASPRAVRMTLEDALLPGVDLAVYEEEGSWVAHFHCQAEAPFIELAGAATELADRTAQALGQSVIWRVQAQGLAADGDWRQTPLLREDGVTAEARALPRAGATGGGA